MSNSEKNYYQLLNLPEFSSIEEIRQRYYELAQKHHPDRQKEDVQDTLGNESFALITQAFNTLKDPEKKKQYDEKLRKRKKEKVQKSSTSRKHTSSPKKGGSLIAEESFQQGMAALRRKDYSRAHYLFKTALNQDSQNASYMSYYALTFIYNKGKLSEGIRYATKAIEKEPFRLEFKLNLAKIYLTVGAKSQAHKWTYEVLGLDPDHKEAQNIAVQLQPEKKTEKKGFLSTLKKMLGKDEK